MIDSDSDSQSIGIKEQYNIKHLIIIIRINSSSYTSQTYRVLYYSL